MTYNVKHCIVGSDINYDLSCALSHNVGSLNKFVLDESLCYCLPCRVLDIEYTYTYNADSLTDNSTMSENLMYCIITYHLLEQIDKLSIPF